jgi:hypothetical protein
LILNAVFGLAGNDVWAAGSLGNAQHWNGSSWSSQPVPLSSTSVLGLSGGGSSVYAGTDGTAVFRWTGTSWGPISPNPNAPASLTGGIWARGDLWVTSTGGAVYNHIGGSWNATQTVTADTLRALAGTGGNDLWAVGDHERIIHWDGARWGLRESTSLIALRSVWAASTSDVWAVGDGGRILHFEPYANIGDPCTGGEGCGSGFCLQDVPFSGGYCSEVIAECPAPGSPTIVCPAGATCENAVVTGAPPQQMARDLCLRSCAVDSDCRVAEGYHCCPSHLVQSARVCVPGSC